VKLARLTSPPSLRIKLYFSRAGLKSSVLKLPITITILFVLTTYYIYFILFIIIHICITLNHSVLSFKHLPTTLHHRREPFKHLFVNGALCRPLADRLVTVYTYTYARTSRLICCMFSRVRFVFGTTKKPASKMPFRIVHTTVVNAAPVTALSAPGRPSEPRVLRSQRDAYIYLSVFLLLSSLSLSAHLAAVRRHRMFSRRKSKTVRDKMSNIKRQIKRIVQNFRLVQLCRFIITLR
jgi:hypothetical protein